MASYFPFGESKCPTSIFDMHFTNERKCYRKYFFIGTYLLIVTSRKVISDQSHGIDIAMATLDFPNYQPDGCWREPNITLLYSINFCRIHYEVFRWLIGIWVQRNLRAYSDFEIVQGDERARTTLPWSLLSRERNLWSIFYEQKTLARFLNISTSPHPDPRIWIKEQCYIDYVYQNSLQNYRGGVCFLSSCRAVCGCNAPSTSWPLFGMPCFQ